MIVLGVETSCDETAVAIVKDGKEVISSVVYSQIDIFEKFGGVIPEVASRKHIQKITVVFEQCLKEANMQPSDIDLVAVTTHPGLIGSLLVGINAAKAFMDQMLADTKERIALKSGVLKHRGTPDAALEEMRRGCKLTAHLDFAEPYGDAEEWIYLLQHGKFNEKAPSSFTVDPDWQNLIEQAPDCWKKFYHQSLRLYRNKDYTSAIKAIEKALSITRNTWTLQAAGNIYLAAGINVEAGLKMLAECVVSPEADAYLIKESLKVLNLQKAYDSVLDCYKKLSERDQSRPMVQLQYAIALARSNRQQEALAVLMQNGGLELPDAREGEVMISALFMELAGENTPMPFVLNYITK